MLRLNPPFEDEQTEAQSGSGPCPQSHSRELALEEVLRARWDFKRPEWGQWHSTQLKQQKPRLELEFQTVKECSVAGTKRASCRVEPYEQRIRLWKAQQDGG